MSERRSGFALLATLWLLVAISVVGLEWAIRTRDTRRAALNAVDRGAAQAAAEAGVSEALARLNDALQVAASAPGTGAALPLDVESDPLFRSDPWHNLRELVPDSGRTSAGVGWRMHLEDAGTRLNLNLASVNELRRFLLALRVDAGRADEIAESIADWRDPDDAPRPHGAERAWYLAHGRLVLPRNGAFDRVSELKYVRGVTNAVYKRAAPLLTVFGDGRIDLMAAPPPVLLALPGIGEQAVRVLLLRRIESRPLGLVTDLERHLSPGAQRRFERALPELLAQTTTQTSEVRISSEGWVAGTPVQVRVEAIAVRGLSSASLAQVEVRP